MRSCWWKHNPSSVVDNSVCKDFSLTADKPIKHNRPDIVDLDKQTNKCYFADAIIPGDTRVKLKTTESIVIYKLLFRSCGMLL